MSHERASRTRANAGVEVLDIRLLPSAGLVLTHIPRSYPTPREIAAAITPQALAVTLTLDPASDPAGDNSVSSSRIILAGKTSPGAVVRLTGAGGANGALRTIADASGRYRFQVNCPLGTTTVTALSSDRAGAQASAVLTMTRANAVIAWNAVALQAIRNTKTQAPDAARALAIVEIAVYDAVNAIDPTAESYRFSSKAPRGASPDAAAASAAYTTLLGLFPDQSAMLGAELAASLAAIPAGASRARGAAFGATVANQVLALRNGDGADVKAAYTPGTAAGEWRPTPPAFAPALDPQWPALTPFALASDSQFRPPPPPALTSVQYAAEYNQVMAIGGTDSTTRTPDQTAVAHFWADLAGTFSPPGHWNQIAEEAALSGHSSLATSARLFALLDVALADAGIAAWDAKYAYNDWRPVTAIRAGNDDGNPLTVGNPTWTPLWSTPPFPSYISGHSTFSAAASTILDAFYGTHFGFTDQGDPTQKLPPRHFSSFEEAAAEAGISRVYGGIHFQSDNVYGLQVGRAVGQYVLQNVLLSPMPGPDAGGDARRGSGRT